MDVESNVSENVKAAVSTAMELGASEHQLLLVTEQVADLFRTGIIDPSSYDKDKVKRAMDLAVIGLLHETGLIP
jgi:hypothetical protein